MPVILTTPTVVPPYADEITKFLVDSELGKIVIEKKELDASGKMLRRLPGEYELASLPDAVKITPEEYAFIKAILYRIGQSDGFIGPGQVI